MESLRIRDFRGIERLSLDLRGPDGRPNQLVVLAGPNGCGKTAILEAALLAAGGSTLVKGAIGKRAVRRGAKDYEIEATFSNAVGSWTVREESGGTSEEGAHPIPHWYFSSWRTPEFIGGVGVSVGRAGRRTLKTDANRLRNVKRQLVDSAAMALFRKEQPELFAQHEEWMTAISRAWKRFRPDREESFRVDLAEANSEGGSFDVFHVDSGGRKLEVQYLSAGQLELFLFIAALVLNDDREGIVFIDEPELHLDPQWHRPVLRTLTELQPNAQFIVATHSPEIFDAARSYERHFLVPEDDPRARLWHAASAGT